MSQWLLHGQEIDISLDRQHRHQYNYERALPAASCDGAQNLLPQIR